MRLIDLVKKAEKYADDDIWSHSAAVVNQQIIKSGPSPYTTDAYLRLAKCYFRNGFIKGSSKYFQKVLSLDANNSEAINYLNSISSQDNYSRNTKRAQKSNLDDSRFKIFRSLSHPPANSKTCPICGGSGYASSDSSLRGVKRHLNSISICKTCQGKGWISSVTPITPYE